MFAPTNAAFDKLPKGTVEMLLKPENKAKLTSILTYHVVPGHLTAADLQATADANGGKAVLKTVEGDSITVMKDSDGRWWACLLYTSHRSLTNYLSLWEREFSHQFHPEHRI